MEGKVALQFNVFCCPFSWYFIICSNVPLLLAEMSKVLSDTKQRIMTLLQNAEKAPCMKEIIAMLPGEVDEELKSLAESKGINLVTFDKVLVCSLKICYAFSDHLCVANITKYCCGYSIVSSFKDTLRVFSRYCITQQCQTGPQSPVIARSNKAQRQQ